MRDIMAPLSDGEYNCVRNAVGVSEFDEILELPLAEVASGDLEISLECLTPGNAIDTSIAIMSAEAGELSAKTRDCISDVAIESPFVLGIGDPPEDPAAAMGPTIRMHLCLEDEEAAAIESVGSAELPPPSSLHCVVEQLGGLEQMVEGFSRGATADQALVLFTLALECEPPTTIGELEGFGE